MMVGISFSSLVSTVAICIGHGDGGGCRSLGSTSWVDSVEEDGGSSNTLIFSTLEYREDGDGGCATLLGSTIL